MPPLMKVIILITLKIKKYLLITPIIIINKKNIVYDKWIISGKPPTRACIEAKLYSPDCKVEVRVIAAASK